MILRRRNIQCHPLTYSPICQNGIDPVGGIIGILSCSMEGGGARVREKMGWWAPDSPLTRNTHFGNPLNRPSYYMPCLCALRISWALATAPSAGRGKERWVLHVMYVLWGSRFPVEGAGWRGWHCPLWGQGGQELPSLTLSAATPRSTRHFCHLNTPNDRNIRTGRHVSCFVGCARVPSSTL